MFISYLFFSLVMTALAIIGCNLPCFKKEVTDGCGCVFIIAFYAINLVMMYYLTKSLFTIKLLN